MMTVLAINHRRMFIVNIVTLLCGILHQNYCCETIDTENSSQLKDILFITANNLTDNTTFPSELVWHRESGIKLCFNILANKTNAGCCCGAHFDCTINTSQHGIGKYDLTVKRTTLINHDIVVLRNPAHNFSCMPSQFYSSSGLILQLDKCLNTSGKNIRLSEEDIPRENGSTDSKACEAYLHYVIDCGDKICAKNVSKVSGPTITPTTASVDTSVTTSITMSPETTETATSKTTGTASSQTTETATSQTTGTATSQTTETTTSLATTKQPTTTTQGIEHPEITITCNISEIPKDPKGAVKVMNDLGPLVKEMGNSSTAAIKLGNITGVIAKLPAQNQISMNFGFPVNGDTNAAGRKSGMGLSRVIKIPKEAVEMAVSRDGTYAAVLLFPGMSPEEKNNFYYNNEVLGIEMGAQISNLSATVDIECSNVIKNGNNASCISWDGDDNSSVWTTEGCQTVETDDSITCRCSHLTFFAILMTPPPANISASAVKSLKQITEAGCGVSMFFLGVALFMHFLIRKNKSSDAAKILINLFIAMFFLNLCFLINKTIADLKNSAACVAIAAFLHYSMLATFTWFTMQALHLYFSLQKISEGIKYYLAKIYITGWVTPAVVVIILLGLKKYNRIVISFDDGTSEDMCWMSDSAVHFGVNIGYYAIVFIFTFTIFVITLVQIVHFGSNAAKAQERSSIKAKLFSIVGLFFILGISWAFAFFSYGPLLIPSYYVFTILNSFQGFLLFIYYYYSTKIVPETQKVPQSSNSTATENIYTK
ncbi:adhesion G-protein coupled receptor G2 isoform X2 [Kryptolebias marmoratus]|uniref:adhesion G-protein coupled receptor G2 isoform X2 n=1 Tax=Kryptolebias marmoratus TaxID=37003 RepID=UPI0007F8E845|nr:adhesion G-protein coupled receptor G2 isoform X2 [Kryptolebias marmoratus]